MPYGGVGDARRHRGRVPAADDQGWAYTDRERALLLQVLDQGVQVPFRALAVPVDRGAVGEVGETASGAWERAVQHERYGRQRLALEPTDALRRPVGLHIGPLGDLEVARVGVQPEMREVFLAGDPLHVRAGHGRALLFGGGHRTPDVTPPVKTSSL